MKKILLLKIATFLSAFLLFQIELIIAKIILPNFGGSYLVWGSCVVFFQASLLLGYKYAQIITEKIGIYRYRPFHIALLCLALLTFPGKALTYTYQLHSSSMVFDIFLHLTMTIGLVFFNLSTMSVILQVWLSESFLEERTNPYTLFSISNLGSFVALLSYPFFFELYFDLDVQQMIWRFSYVILIILVLLIYRFIDVQEAKSIYLKNGQKVASRKKIQWILYGSAGVMIFLSITNIITIEIAPAPLLWVIPLATYLLTYVLVFKKNSWTPQWIKSNFHLMLGFGILFYFLMKTEIMPVLFEGIVLIAIAFIFCLFSHFKLYMLKPSKFNQLPLFYFYASLGGFLGGLLVTWIIPKITTGLLEYFLGFVAISVALQMEGKQQFKRIHLFLIALFLVLIFMYPMILPNYSFLGWISLAGCIVLIFSKMQNDICSLTISIILVIGLSNIIEPIWSKNQIIYKKRNYYGINKIYEQASVRYFLHGTTIHGAQHMGKEKQPLPLTYFALDSPLGELLSSKLVPLENIGILGLGIGTMSTYFNRTQRIDYFELDPDVLELAKKYFTFLKNSRGQTQFFIGDARLKLNEIAPLNYDIIIADAFSGDALPVHLLTQEALSIYRDHLNPEGIILFNISNRYIDSGYPLLSTAISLGAKGCFKNGIVTYPHTYASTWIAVTWDDSLYNKLISELGWNKVPNVIGKKYRKWTDKYSSILPFIKYDELWLNMRNFKVFNI